MQTMLHQGQFQAAITQYELNLANGAEDIAQQARWLYGLALLLNGQEEDAQMTWMMAMMDGDEATVTTWLTDLGNILEQNATFQFEQGDVHQASRIRYHLREILPQNSSNLLQIIKLELLKGELTLEQFAEFDIVELLTEPDAKPAFAEQSELLLEVLDLYLDKAFVDEVTVSFVTAVQPHISPQKFIRAAFAGAIKIGHFRHIPQLAIPLLDLCANLEPNDIEILIQLAEMLIPVRSYKRAMEVGNKLLVNTRSPINQVIGSYYILKSCLNEGKDRSAILQYASNHESYLAQFIEQRPSITYAEARHIIASVHLLTYVNDNPIVHRTLQNQILSIVQAAIQDHWYDECQNFQANHKQRIDATQNSALVLDRPLRIGYICSCFYSHSVGWLARTLMFYHDEQNFEIYVYGVNIPPDDHPVKRFYRQVAHQYRSCGFDTGAIAEQILQDQIDILIDLDSITRDTVCTVMAMKPAPIQATWLGWDAIGMNAIDYYIADNYSLPEQAQDYYTEKIWRLPHAFLAVDGFEVGIPTVRRSELNIPEDAVVFLNPQRGYKLSPEVLSYQLEILKSTPNSYLLLKGVFDYDSLEALVGEAARTIGVSLDRLRPVPYTTAEEMHRANLAIADVILDTFPYNGATTTTEALWMEIPIVTLVGQQFSARNSYALMRSAGITEGISWTPEEYIEWGIRMGTDAELRQQVSWKLRQGKRSAPLWNGKAFAQEMEAAYVQMYQNYVASIQDQAKA
jgi:predicted O-linked N-acetylglucosamine transferase (SPINDLY family)